VPWNSVDKRWNKVENVGAARAFWPEVGEVTDSSQKHRSAAPRFLVLCTQAVRLDSYALWWELGPRCLAYLRCDLYSLVIVSVLEVDLRHSAAVRSKP